MQAMQTAMAVQAMTGGGGMGALGAMAGGGGEDQGGFLQMVIAI